MSNLMTMFLFNFSLPVNYTECSLLFHFDRYITVLDFTTQHFLLVPFKHPTLILFLLPNSVAISKESLLISLFFFQLKWGLSSPWISILTMCLALYIVYVFITFHIEIFNSFILFHFSVLKENLIEHVLNISSKVLCALVGVTSTHRIISEFV